MPPPSRVLILGGTTEASALARLLAPLDGEFAPMLSLAGVTTRPLPAPIPRRTGGFGGADGLARFLRESGIDLLVDATHPFASRITANADAAARAAGVRLLRLCRPGWDPAGTEPALDMAAAFRLIGDAPRRVLLTVGRQDLAPFGPPHRYWLRSIEAPAPGLVPAGATLVPAILPLDVATERALLERHAIEVLVTKNSGGEATRAKLDAARALAVRVLMVARPAEPEGARVETAHQALAWLRAPGPAGSAGSLRGA